MKLICAADLHLGRVPSRVPPDLVADPSVLAPKSAWHALVDTAIEERADAVLLSGDVVEDRRDFYEAFADLQTGVGRLREADIAVFAVSGNHDVDVLPRLVDEMEGVRLLGRGGRWQCVPFEAGGRRVRLLGWSFPSERVSVSPLAGGLGDALHGTGPGPVIGLLHADLDASGSAYAPVRGAELRAAGVDAWLLGHVHAPHDLSSAPVGYLGSLSAADPGEPGPRGAWRLHVSGEGRVSMEPVPLTPIRYETVDVPLDDLARADEVPSLVVRALVRAVRDLGGAGPHLRALGVRIDFTGRTALLHEVRSVLTSEEASLLGAWRETEGVRAFVHDWRLEALPDVDLAAAARGSDPVAIVARTLRTLREGPEEARAALVRALRARTAEVDRRPAFAVLGPQEPDDETLAAHLETAAVQALDELLAQREGRTP